MTTPTEPTPTPPPPSEKRSGPMRIVKRIILALVVLIVIALIGLYVGLNAIVKKAIVSQSSTSLNVPTNLGDASVSLFGGKVSLKNFDVGSPQGFRAPQLMQLGGLDVGVKLGDLRGDPIRIDEIAIRDPKMVIEMAGTEFNIKKFIDSLPTGDPKPADDSKPMKLIINSMKVNGAQVIFRPDLQALASLPGIGSNLGGLKQEYVLSIPPLDLQNIGTAAGNQNGAAIKDVVTLLVTKLAAKAAESDQLPPELRQLLNLNVDDVMNMAKAKLGAEVNKQLRKITEDLTKKVGGDAGKALGDVLKNSPDDLKKDSGKAIGEGLGGLLNQKKDKKPPTTQK